MAHEPTKKITVPEGSDLAKLLRGILKAAGSWKDIDTEAFKAYIAERRQAAKSPHSSTGVTVISPPTSVDN
jgi:hypothetical protein